MPNGRSCIITTLGFVFVAIMRARAERRMRMRTVGDYVRHWRREAGLTRHQLARRAGVSYGYVCQIEGNRAGLPRAHLLRALAAVLAPSPEDAQMLLDLANQTRVP